MLRPEVSWQDQEGALVIQLASRPGSTMIVTLLPAPDYGLELWLYEAEECVQRERDETAGEEDLAHLRHILTRSGGALSDS